MLHYRLDKFFIRDNIINKEAILCILIMHSIDAAHSLQCRLRDNNFMNTNLIKKSLKEELYRYLKKNEKTELNISEENIYKIADSIEIAGLKTHDTVKVEVKQITKQEYERLEGKIKVFARDNTENINGLIVSLVKSNDKVEKIIIYATEIISDTVNNEFDGFYVDEINLIDGTVLSIKDTNRIAEENISKLNRLLNEIDKTVDKYSAVILNAILDKYLTDTNDIKNYIGEFIKSNKGYKSKALNSLMDIYNSNKLMYDLERCKDEIEDIIDCEIHFETSGLSYTLIRSDRYSNYNDSVLEIHIAITIPPDNRLITKKSLQKIIRLVENCVSSYRNGKEFGLKSYCMKIQGGNCVSSYRNEKEFRLKSYCMKIQGIQNKVYFTDLNFLLNNYSKFQAGPTRKIPGFSISTEGKFRVDLSSIPKEDKKSLLY